jgi:hypothetical protein
MAQVNSVSATEAIEQPITWRFWILSIVLTAVLVTVSMWWVLFQSGQCLLSMSLLAALTYYMPLVFISLFFMAMISRTKRFKGRINIYHMTYFYAILAALAWPGSADTVFIPATYWMSSVRSPTSVNLVPWWFGPSREIASQMVAGGVPIPWLAYVPSLIWWWWIYALWALFMIGLSGILRRQWVDVEQVPFPQTMVAYDLARSVEPKFRARLRSREFLIGMVLGGGFVILMFMIINFPWFPDIYGWRTNTCSSGFTYITADSPFAGVIAFVGSTKQPLNVAIFYLAPMTILFNIWFWWIVLAILTQVAYAFGYYTGVPGTGGCGRIYGCPTGSIIYQQPFVWQVFGSMGMSIGIALGYIIVNRRYIGETIRTSLGRQTGLKESEKNEPFRYRTSWILCIVTMILLAASFMASGMSFAPAWITIFVTILFAFCWARTWGLGGFWAPSGFYSGPGFYKWIWPVAPEPITQDWYLSMGLSVLPATNVPYAGWQHYFMTTMASSRLASLTKTSQKNIFKISIAVSLVTPLMAMLAWIGWTYTFGLTRSPQYHGDYGAYSVLNPDTVVSFVSTTPAIGLWWPQAIAGVLTAMALSYLHARLTWFPLEPIGMLIGIDAWSMELALWQLAGIAWILKALTLRIGGSKAYEEHGILVAGGLLVGYALAVLFVGIVGLYRFFFPF